MRISDWSSDVCSSDLGDRDHTTIMHAVRRADRIRLRNPQFRAITDAMLAAVEPTFPIPDVQDAAQSAVTIHVCHHPSGTAPLDFGTAKRTKAFFPSRRSVRSEERRVGKECVGQGSTRWAP